MIGIINSDPHSEAIVDQEFSVQLIESLASDIKSHQVIDILSLMNLTWPDNGTEKSVDEKVADFMRIIQKRFATASIKTKNWLAMRSQSH